MSSLPARDQAGRITVAVMGSCMTRDCFTNQMNPGYDRGWHCISTQHQSSLVGLVAPPVEVLPGDLDGMKERDQWILREDCEKEFLTEIIDLQPRVLVMDFWADVFFGFRRIGSTFITDNDWTLPQSPFLRRIQRDFETESLTIEHDPEAYLERWRIAARSLRQFLDRHLPDTLVVLHRGTATDELVEAEPSVSLTASGECIPRDVHRLNELWSRLDDIAEEELTDQVVDLGGHRFPSTTAHCWGAGYVHYVDGYYNKALTALERLATAAPRGAVWAEPEALKRVTPGMDGPPSPSPSRERLASDVVRRPSVATGPAVEFDPDRADLIEGFSNACRTHPTRPAVLDQGRAYSYAELAARVSALSRRLATVGVEPGDCVYVCADRGITEVVTVLATLATGAAFVALRPDAPATVLEHQVATVRGRVAVHDGRVHGFALIGRLQALSPGLVVVDASNQPDPESGVRSDLDDLMTRAEEDRPGLRTAYVGFTSGSTGLTKAARITHRAVARLAAPGGQTEIVCGPGSSFLRLAPLSFDASTLEIFLPLLSGGRLVIGPPDPVSVTSLRRALESGEVTHLWLTVGLMRIMAMRAPSSFARVRHLLTGGDVVPPEAVRRLLATNPGLWVTNGYGPTENTTFTALAHFDDPDALVAPLPIGRPLAGGGVVILGPDRCPVPIGSPGEIAAFGLGLANDYWRDPAQTAAKFIEVDGIGRVYLTGDLGHLDDDGCVHYGGRADGQVKVRGMRIETDGVRQVLVDVPGVRDALVFAEPDTDVSSRRLVAAVVVADGPDGPEPSVVQLRAYATDRLLPYEVPQLWCLVTALPLTANHKVDLRRLRELALAGRRDAGRGRARS
jgi:amino acid adenylation domain-containing protein